MNTLFLETGLAWTSLAWLVSGRQIWRAVLEHQPMGLAVLSGLKARVEPRRHLALVLCRQREAIPGPDDEVAAPALPERAGPWHPRALGVQLGAELAELFKTPLRLVNDEFPAGLEDGRAIKRTGRPDLARPWPLALPRLWAAAREAAGAEAARGTIGVVSLEEEISLALFHQGVLTDSVAEDEGPFGPGAAGALPWWSVNEDCRAIDQGAAAGLGPAALTTAFWDGPEAESWRRALALNLARFYSLMLPSAPTPPDLLVLTGRFCTSGRLVEAAREALSKITPRLAVLPPQS